MIAARDALARPFRHLRRQAFATMHQAAFARVLDQSGLLRAVEARLTQCS